MHDAMKQIHYFLLVLLIFAFSCKEETVKKEDTQKPARPELSARGTANNNFSFTYSIAQGLEEGTLYYLGLKESEGQPSAEAMKANAFTVSVVIRGGYFNKAGVPVTAAKTTYVLYAFVEAGGVASDMATLKVTTE